MNSVGACGIAMMGFAILFNVYGQSAGRIAIGFTFHTLLFGVALGTVRALSEGSSKRLQQQMLWLNGGLICIYLCAVATVLTIFDSFYAMKIVLIAMSPVAVLMVLPELINVRALRLKSKESQT
jgi:undecaprenyl pyrophosphate phosphatase UppP